jgi:hypothetical protein
MSNASLLATVEQLQESYTQQHRALKTLLGAFKNTGSTLGKVNRALRDYVAQLPDAPPESVEGAQQAFAGLQLKDEILDPVSADLRREVKLVSALETALKDAANALRGEAVDVVRLGHAVAALQARAPQTADAGLHELLPPLQTELQEAERTLGETFGEALRHAASAQGLVLDGRPPRFAIGRFEITANFPARAAAISYGKEQVVKRVPLSVDALLKAYQREAKSITGRNEDGQRWIELLYQAWLNVRRKKEITGNRVNLVDCYLELIFLRQGRAFRVAPSRSTMAEYSRAQFAYDFVEFVERQRLHFNGQRAHVYASTKSQTDSAERSIWIVEGATPFEGRYISDVTFSNEA